MEKDYIHSYTKNSFDWKVFRARKQSKTALKYGLTEFVITNGPKNCFTVLRTKPPTTTYNSEDKYFDDKKGHTKWLQRHPLTRLFK